MIDYNELSADILSGCEQDCADCKYVGENAFECTITQLVAAAITDLLSRVEAAEARAEKAERERDAAVEELENYMVQDVIEGNEPCGICEKASKIPCEVCDPKWSGLKEE